MPTRSAYCLSTEAGEGPGRRKTSRMPDSETQCVKVEEEGEEGTKAARRASSFSDETASLCCASERPDRLLAV